MALTKVRSAGVDSLDRSKLTATLSICSYSNVANGGFAATTWEAIPFATELLDTGSDFNGSETTDNNAGGVFTVPADGKYFISVVQAVTCTTTSRLTQARIRLVLNTTGDATDGGTEIQGTDCGFLVPDNSIATEFTCSTSIMQSFSAGNKIWCQLYPNVGAGQARANDGNFTVIQID
tara:strand:+ start:555 stop:1088 length:534 start_codon:yes stop_codon:yes gene_type:complete